MTSTDPTRALIDHLVALGADAADLDGLEAGDLIGMAGDIQLAEGLDRTLDGFLAETGCSREEVESVYALLGLSIDALVGFGDGDVALMSLVTADTSGIIDTIGAQLLRVAGSSAARLAEATVAAYVQDIEPQGHADIDLVVAAEENALASALAVVLSEQLPTVFRHHMWTAVRRQRRSQAGVESPEIVRLAVGFVDLVGFTSLSNEVSAAELIATIEDFEVRAFEAATRHGARVVKSIGDEVMIAGPDLAAVAATAFELIAGASGDPSIAPRGGVSGGEVLFRLGDYYGPVVNLAARLTAEAVPGEVLTDLVVEPGSGIETTPGGRRTLKGFAEPVPVWTIESVDV